MKHTKGERIANHIYKIDCTCTICNYLRIKINAELLEALKFVTKALGKIDAKKCEEAGYFCGNHIEAEQLIAKAEGK